MKKLSIFTLVLALLTPFMSFAADDIPGVFMTLIELLRDVIPLLLTLAVIFFMIGVLKFMLKAGTPEGRKEGISTMIWGIIALFVLVSFWGIVAIIQNTFGIDSGLSVSVPGFHF